MSNDDTITHCAACGRSFGPGRRRWTFARWFKCGGLRLDLIVCLFCKHKRVPDSYKTRKAAS